MKILHITDSHGTAKGPESRRDIYYIAFLKKLYELGFVIKQQKIDLVIHTGDLFHTARVSDKFAGQTAELIKAMGVPFYVVPGNHDIEGYTTNTMDQTKLGLLAKTGVVKILDRDNPIRIDVNNEKEDFTVAISGQEYYAHIDEGNQSDFEMQQDEADVNILAIHGYLADTPQHPDIKCTMCKDIVTDADIILTGHYHRQFEYKNDFEVYNPGSMMRVEQTEYNKTHMPHYGILEINVDKDGYMDWNYQFHQFRIAEPSTTIFDYDSKYQAKHTSITLEGFKNSIASTMLGASSTNHNIAKMINDICIDANVGVSVTSKTLDMYNNALQNSPDEFEVKQGFIQSNYVKKIQKVILKNFQSHENSIIEFSDGLNIIVGESNNGKTSILRGIMWVIDNQPLGTDFIMAGKDECSVKIEYDDGTSIERGRTIKDTGYYKIVYKDENGAFQTQEYRGFTNAIPVEVSNVHQMPKISITKDIETHLNVLSQLDGPFLLTESPLVKASAIGRITGTHIIDAAIKDSNKTIISNRKTVKVHEETIKEKQDKLKQLPDINTLTEFQKAYSNIVNNLVKRQKDNEYVEKSLISLNEITDKIDIQTIELNKLKTLRNINPIVNSASNRLSFISTLDSNLNSLSDIDNNIVLNTNIINSNKIFVAMSPIVTKTIDMERSCYILDEKVYKLENINKVEVLCKHDSAIYREYSNLLKSIQAYSQILFDYITKVNPKMECIELMSFKQTEAVALIGTIKKELATIKRKITGEQNRKNKFIVDNGICPCCGQKITDSHISNISEFMGGN